MTDQQLRDTFGYTSKINSNRLSPRVANKASFQKFYKDYKENKKRDKYTKYSIEPKMNGDTFITTSPSNPFLSCRSSINAIPTNTV